MDVDLSLLPDDFEDCLTSNYEILLRSPFRLLDLPPELWIRVCELAVIRPKSIVLGRESDFADMAKIVRQPNITRACRLLRSEALPVFYGLNEFEMVHNYLVPCPRHFLVAIGAANLKKIGTILIHSNCSHQWWENTFQRGKIKCKVEMVGTNLKCIVPLSWRIWAVANGGCTEDKRTGAMNIRTQKLPDFGKRSPGFSWLRKFK